MRLAARLLLFAAAVTCFAGTASAQDPVDLPAPPMAEKPIDIMAVLLEPFGRDKPTTPVVPGYGGDNSCQWARDGECDEVGVGTGACRPGTDYADCWRIVAGVEDDSCRWSNDGECDEPGYGLGYCTQATDASDCGDIARLRFQDDSCSTAFDGVCNDPDLGDGACAAGTDRSDCVGRERPKQIADHFHGRDDRVLLDTGVYPWAAIGRFESIGNDATCTATLIGDAVIVTAAHCIETEGGIDARGRFVAGWSSAGIEAYLLSPDRGSKAVDDTATDWALLRLDRSLAGEIEPIDVRALTLAELADPSSVALYQAGYSWDTGDNLSGHLGCRIREVGVELLHDCDSTSGDSGSPFMVEDDGRYFIVATDSAFDIAPFELTDYVATLSDPWVTLADDFAAGRIGVEIDGKGSAK